MAWYSFEGYQWYALQATDRWQGAVEWTAVAVVHPRTAWFGRTVFAKFCFCYPRNGTGAFVAVGVPPNARVDADAWFVGVVHPTFGTGGVKVVAAVRVRRSSLCPYMGVSSHTDAKLVHPTRFIFRSST